MRTKAGRNKGVWAKTVPIDIFRCGVCLLVGKDVNELRKAFCHVASGCRWGDLDPGAYFDRLMTECEKAGQFSGITVGIGGEPDKTVWIPEWSEMTLIHEIVHAVDLVLADKGVDDRSGEMRAYLTEYLFGKFALEA